MPPTHTVPTCLPPFASLCCWLGAPSPRSGDCLQQLAAAVRRRSLAGTMIAWGRPATGGEGHGRAEGERDP